MFMCISIILFFLRIPNKSQNVYKWTNYFNSTYLLLILYVICIDLSFSSCSVTRFTSTLAPWYYQRLYIHITPIRVRNSQGMKIKGKQRISRILFKVWGTYRKRASTCEGGDGKNINKKRRTYSIFGEAFDVCRHKMRSGCMRIRPGENTWENSFVAICKPGVCVFRHFFFIYE